MHTVLLATLILFGVICIAAGVVMVSGVIGGSDNDDKETAATDLPPTKPGLQLDTALSSNLTVVLKATAATDPDDTTLDYYWDMGDGTQPKQGGLACTYSYPGNGSYLVTLIVTDGKNFNSTSTRVSLGATSSNDSDDDTVGIDENDGYDYSDLPPAALGGGDDDDAVAPKDEQGTENTIFSTNDGNGVKMAGAATIAIGVVVIAIAIIIIVVLVAVVRRKNATEAATEATKEKKP